MQMRLFCAELKHVTSTPQFVRIEKPDIANFIAGQKILIIYLYMYLLYMYICNIHVYVCT